MPGADIEFKEFRGDWKKYNCFKKNTVKTLCGTWVTSLYTYMWTCGEAGDVCIFPAEAMAPPVLAKVCRKLFFSFQDL